MMAINTVAAGGGSILHFDGARFRVGPDSAGADPGPACYRRGGPLTVTDANVCVGKIQPAHFPAIFGPNGDQPLDARCGAAKFAALADEIATRHRPAAGPARRWPRASCAIAVANMANAIKQVSVQKGHDATRFALQCFGGAGGQHACLVADALGMETVFIHPFAGVLSAYGMGLADQTVDARAGGRDAARAARDGRSCDALADRLADEATRGACCAGRRSGAHRRRAARLHLRYAGTEAALIVPSARATEIVADVHRGASRALRLRHARTRALVVEAVAVEAIAAGEAVRESDAARRAAAARPSRSTRIAHVHRRRRAYRAGVRPHRSAGGRPHRRPGADPRGQRHHRGRARLDRRGHRARPHDPAPHRAAARPACAADSGRPDPVLLELFNNLFMNVAEQTGAVLQNTSMSVNIKERLDFSCAIFDADGLPGGQRAACAGASRRDGRKRAHRAARPRRTR